MSEQRKQEVRSFVENELKRQVDFCVQQYDLGDWYPALEVTFATNRKSSKAGRNVLGKPFISLALRDYLHEVNGFLEYDDYARNALIGSFKSNEWRTCLTALIAHELSHAVQFTLPMAKSPKAVAHYNAEPDREGHGKLFRDIYRTLRKEFVNNLVPYYNMGIDPPPVAEVRKGPKHPLEGKQFIHCELGKVTVTAYNTRARKYPIEFMNVAGAMFKTSEESFKRKAKPIL